MLGGLCPPLNSENSLMQVHAQNPALKSSVIKLGIVFSLLSAATYGLNPVFAKLGYAYHLGGIEILHARFLFATLVLGFVGPLLEKNFYRFSAYLIKSSIFIATVILIPLNLLYVYALKDIPASMMSLITYVYPLIILIINCLIFRKPLRVNQVISVIFILLGCLCIFSDALKINLTTGALALGFLSTLMYAIYLLSLQQLATKVSAYQITFLTILFSTLGLCLFHNPLSILEFSSGQLAVTFGYGTVSTVMSTIFVSRAVQLLGATEAGIFCSFEPVFTIGFAALLLGETIPAFRWFGMVFLILGIVIPNRKKVIELFQSKSQP